MNLDHFPQKRDSNIELLRIILMFMVLLIHFTTHGCSLFDNKETFVSSNGATIVELFIFSFLVVAVNSFVFISGFYRIKFNLKTLFSFIIQAVFYSVFFYLVFNFNHINKAELIRYCFPIYTKVWWFLTAFIGLYFLAPLLNKGMDILKKTQLEVIVIGLLIFAFSGFFLHLIGKNTWPNSGFNTCNFVIIYVIAGYMRKYNKNVKHAFLWYILLCLTYFGIFILLFWCNKSDLAIKMFAYTNPLVFFAAICLFFTFKNMKIKSNDLINKTSILTFGVYLIHDFGYVRIFLADCVQSIRIHAVNDIHFFLYFFLFAVLVFAICLCIEKIRQIIFNPLIRFIPSFKSFRQIKENNGHS